MVDIFINRFCKHLLFFFDAVTERGDWADFSKNFFFITLSLFVKRGVLICIHPSPAGEEQWRQQLNYPMASTVKTSRASINEKCYSDRFGAWIGARTGLQWYLWHLWVIEWVWVKDIRRSKMSLQSNSGSKSAWIAFLIHKFKKPTQSLNEKQAAQSFAPKSFSARHPSLPAINQASHSHSPSLSLPISLLLLFLSIPGRVGFLSLLSLSLLVGLFISIPR